MRIIAGKYKKSNLYTLEGNDTRPTTDALKESIFSSLFDVTDYVVLDLFAGSGALALEAISRGAKYAVFVENSYHAVQVIKKNINKIKCRNQTKIIKTKVYNFLENCNSKFDLIFLDPPYNKSYVNKTLDMIEQYNIINEGGFIVAEHFYKEDIDPKWEKMIVYKKDKGKNRVAIIKYNKI
jgi:16S rRNA (guanine(966)-N(2))-methyltransferase RsmD